MVKINYFINSKSGLGHCSRVIAIAQALAKKESKCEIRILHHPNTEWFLKSHIQCLRNCQLIPLSYESNYDNSSFDPNNIYSTRNEEIFWAENNKIISVLLDADIYVSDWIGQVGYIRAKARNMKKNRLFVGLYHSDVWIHETDNINIKNWKNHIKYIVDNMLDLFIHITPKLPPTSYPFRTPTISVPLIVRQPITNVEIIKKNTGLEATDKYVLLNLGIGYLDRQYVGKQHLPEFIEVIPFRNIIVLGASSIKDSELHIDSDKKVTFLPQSDFGQNLVASASMVITKPGMSIISECVAHRIPLLLLPPDNAEHFLKIELLKTILGFEPPVTRDFSSPSLLKGIQLTLELSSKLSFFFATIPSTGGEVVADIINLLCEMPRKLDHRATLKLSKLAQNAFTIK